jgi:hypothetical protein
MYGGQNISRSSSLRIEATKVHCIPEVGAHHSSIPKTDTKRYTINLLSYLKFNIYVQTLNKQKNIFKLSVRLIQHHTRRTYDGVDV